MPVESKKLIATLLEECQRLPERCDGYRQTLEETVTDILGLERQHQRQATNIRKKIEDQVDATATFLAANTK